MWSNGLSTSDLNQHSSIPVLHHCILILVSDILRKPFQGQGMTESFGFCQIVRGAADSGELQSLSALIVQKGNLLIVGSSRPTAGHDVRHRADVGIVDFEMR